MNKSLRLNVVSPDGTLYEGDVLWVTLPGSKGEFTILPQHAPIISTLIKGKIKYATPDATTHSIEVVGGFIEMNNNVVSVCIN